MTYCIILRMIIKFLTLNTLHGGMVWNNLVGFVRREDPDIAVFQEVYDSHDPDQEKRLRTMEEFRKEFPELKYSVFLPSLFEISLNTNRGNAIFSKFPIENPEYYYFNSGYQKIDHRTIGAFQKVPCGMVKGEIKIEDKLVNVYSAHGVWDTHGEDTPARDKMTDIVINNLRGKERIILAGDMNLHTHTNFVKRIERELNLESVFKDLLVSTFNMNYKKEVGGYDKAAVDMIFVSKNIGIQDKYMSMDDVSDHRPLIATLEI